MGVKHSMCGLAATGSLACLLWLPVAHAQPAQVVCVDAAVTVTGGFDAVWAQELERVCASLQTLPDRDPHARLELAAAETGASLTVHLADGRSGRRLVSRPEDLGSAVEALLTLPPAPVAEPAARAPTPPPPPPDRPAVVRPAASNDERPTAIRFDLAALATSRLLGAPATLGIGTVVSGTMAVDDAWLVGLRARLDPVLINLSEHGEVEGGAFGGGVEGARRVRLAEAVKLDFGLGVDGLADVPYGGGRDGGGRDGGRDGDDVSGDMRTRAFAKVLVSGQGVSFAGLLGFELSPLRIGDSGRRERPAYGGELGLGIGWGGGP
jgi:hypothetical protein